MGQAFQYTTTTDFSQQEANNTSGRSTINTAALDAEFANIAQTLSQIQANLALLQRDDGKLKDHLTEIHTLSPEVLHLMGGFRLRGLWAASVSYAVNDIATRGEYTYACIQAHHSDSAFDDQYWRPFGLAGGADAAQAAAMAQTSEQNTVKLTTAAATSASEASHAAADAATNATAAATNATLSAESAASAQLWASVVKDKVLPDGSIPISKLSGALMGDKIVQNVGLQGSPTALTAAKGDKTTKLATTEFVANHGLQSAGQVIIAASMTLSDDMAGKNLLVTTPGITLTLPSNSAKTFCISNSSADAIVLIPQGTATGIDAGNHLAAYRVIVLTGDGAGYWRLIAEGVTGGYHHLISTAGRVLTFSF